MDLETNLSALIILLSIMLFCIFSMELLFNEQDIPDSIVSRSVLGNYYMTTDEVHLHSNRGSSTDKWYLTNVEDTPTLGNPNSENIVVKLKPGLVFCVSRVTYQTHLESGDSIRIYVELINPEISRTNQSDHILHYNSNDAKHRNIAAKYPIWECLDGYDWYFFTNPENSKILKDIRTGNAINLPDPIASIFVHNFFLQSDSTPIDICARADPDMRLIPNPAIIKHFDLI